MKRQPRNMIQRARQQAGFTLIEILVTLGVSTFALLGVVSTIRVASRASVDAQRANEAIGIAEGMMEVVRSMSVDKFENLDWQLNTDGRLPTEPPSNCPHTGKPYTAIVGTTVQGSEQSWTNNGPSGGCDDPNWKEWHEGPMRGRSGIEYRRGVRYAQVEADLVWIQVIVEWTNEGALAGTSDGRYDRAITMEAVRSRLEAPP